MKTLGIDVGGTNVRAAVVDDGGKILADARRPARATEGFDASMPEILAAAQEALAQHKVSAAGLGFPGCHDSDRGVCLVSPNFDRSWWGRNITGPLSDALGIACRLLNDANAAALGEYTYGAGRDARNMVMITLGTGIGGAIILDGKILLGAAEGAGEIGHTIVDPNGPPCGCGNHGCYETLAARDAIIDRAVRKIQTGRKSSLARDILEIRKLTPERIAEHAEAGDAVAIEVMAETGYWVGIGLVNVVNLLNPDMIVIGGGIAQAGDILFDPVRRTVAARAIPYSLEKCRIEPALLGDDAGVIGAAVRARGMQ
jgi:glucokinase